MVAALREWRNIHHSASAATVENSAGQRTAVATITPLLPGRPRASAVDWAAANWTTTIGAAESSAHHSMPNRCPSAGAGRRPPGNGCALCGRGGRGAAGEAPDRGGGGGARG